MTLNEATILAEELVEMLRPFCERCMIAGSIRRKKEHPKDIEIVCIPKSIDVTDMFGTVIGQERDLEFVRLVSSLPKIKGEASAKYTQRRYKDQVVDIFMCEKENWGNTCIIRTGDAEFCHLLMKRVNKLGFVQQDGYLYSEGKIPLFEEIDYFNILNLPYIEPEDRDEEAFKKIRFATNTFVR